MRGVDPTWAADGSWGDVLVAGGDGVLVLPRAVVGRVAEAALERG